MTFLYRRILERPAKCDICGYESSAMGVQNHLNRCQDAAHKFAKATDYGSHLVPTVDQVRAWYYEQK